MAENEEELKSLLMKVKEANEKAGLNLNIHKQISWYLVPSLHCKQVEKMETVADCIFLGNRITVAGDCSHEIKNQCLLERKAMTNNIL